MRSQSQAKAGVVPTAARGAHKTAGGHSTLGLSFHQGGAWPGEGSRGRDPADAVPPGVLRTGILAGQIGVGNLHLTELFPVYVSHAICRCRCWGADGGGRDRRTGTTAGVYTISVAAELAGCDGPLVAAVRAARAARPARTSGGTRRYSQDDLRRLRRIAELVADGVNLTGIGKILDLEQDTHELRTDNTALRADNARLQADRDRPGQNPFAALPTNGHRDQPSRPG